MDGIVYPGYLMNLFHVRKDIFAKGTYYESLGKWSFFPACNSFWKRGACLKRENKERKEKGASLIPNPCQVCHFKQWTPLSKEDILSHLRMDLHMLIAVSPILEDGTCTFLTFQFSGTSSTSKGFERAKNVAKILNHFGIDYLFEVNEEIGQSRVFVFFEKPIFLKEARDFGITVLAAGVDIVDQKDFISYDCLLPSKDTCLQEDPKEFIPLPLDGWSYSRQKAWLSDENGFEIEYAWKRVREVQKVSDGQRISFLIDQEKNLAFLDPNWSNKILKENGKKRSKSESLTLFENGKQQDQKRNTLFDPKQIQVRVKIRKSDHLYISKECLDFTAQNTLRRLAAYANPQYIENERLNYSNHQTKRIIWLGKDTEEEVVLPRGLEELLIKHLKQSKIEYQIVDECNKGKILNTKFQGELRPQQSKVMEEMEGHTCGIIESATGSGKTVMGASLIARRNTSTLIVVPNKTILSGWLKDLKTFLDFSELPIKGPGVLGASRNTLNGWIDIAMVQSLEKQKDIETLLDQYGMILIDECHHAFAKTYKPIFNHSKSMFRFGLSATPKRTDGQEPAIFMELGPVRTKFSAKDQAALQNFERIYKERKIGEENIILENLPISKAYQCIRDDQHRNCIIAQDARRLLKQNRNVLILTKHREHAQMLYELLKEESDCVFQMTGGQKAKEIQETKERLDQADPQKGILLIGTGSFIGEGFNVPRLDTLLLAAPVAADVLISQYAGRLHREYPGKKQVLIVDYVDQNIPVFLKMFKKREAAYLKNGYSKR